MQIRTIPFQHIPDFSKRDKAYTLQDDRLRPFYKYPVTPEAFSDVISDKSQESIDRDLLVDVLQEQYHARHSFEAVQQNIEKLRSSATFTLVTAHQPSLFTGPLYYIYKILSTLNLCEDLNRAYPEYEFVPLFISGNEDHDFEEINHLDIFGKKVVWENEESGAVGMMSLESLKGPLEEIREILGDSPNGREMYLLLKEAYTGDHNYGEAAIRLANTLFGHLGLVILNTNDARLKRAFIPHIRKEIFEQPSQALIEKAGAHLEEQGYDLQAFPREINFFYLGEQIRNRIVEENGRYQILDTDISFSREELEQEIEDHPERFSPNVVMRPIYQEAILPNLAYIGGGGEIAYWLERKTQFEHFDINFPMLIRRHSALWVDKGSVRKLDKLDLHVEDLLKEEERTIKEYVRKHAGEQLSLEREKAAVAEILQGVVELAQRVDPTLIKKVKAEKTNQLNSLSQLEGRLIKAEKQKQEVAVKQIRSLYSRLFPDRGLQERHANFMELFVRHGWNAMEVLKENFQPFRTDFVVIEEN